MDTQTVVHLTNGVLLNNKKEQIRDTSNTMGKSLKHAAWEKPCVTQYALYGSNSMKF